MPHKSTLPPLPADILTPYHIRRKLERAFAARRFAESGGLRQHSANPDDDALLALQSALQSGADPKQIQELLGQSEVAQKTGFKERFMGALRSVGLPFEAFSEGVNALIGPLVPQQKFQERSAQSRALLKSMFGGDLSVAEAAGALRDVYEQRSGWEQLITGLVFDPTNILVPGAIGVKAGIKAGAQAGVKTGARTAARSYLEWQLPFVGGKIAGRLGLEATQRLIRDAAGAAPAVESRRMRLERLAAEYSPAGGSGEFESLLSRATPSEQATLRSAMGQFYEALDTPEKFADVPGFDRLVKLHRATITPTEKALFQLTLETAGRSFEPSWAQVQDIIWGDNRVLFHAKTREPGAARLSPPLTDQTMTLLQEITAGKAPTDPIFLKADFGIRGRKGAALGASFNSWLKGLGERAGETLPTGITIRNQVASAYRALLERGGAPVSLTRHLLGHADDRLFTSYTARAGMPQENLSLLRFMDADEVFIPLPTKAGAGAEATAAATRGVAAEVKATPEFKDVISRKGKGAKRTAKSAQARLGEAKVDALDITEPDTWAPRLAAVKSDVDHDLLLDALRAVEAQRAVLQLEQAEEAAKLVQEVAGKATPIAIRMHRFAVAAFKERQTLALGLQDRVVNELAPRLSKIRETLLDLKVSGLVDDRDISFFMEQMRFLPVTVKATLETTKGGFIPHRISVSAKTLKELKMTSADTAEMFHLSNIEKADSASAMAAVGEWLDNDKVRKVLHTMGVLTVEKEITGIKRWVVQSGAPALVTKLHRMASVGSTTQHMLGADLVRTPSQGGLNETRRLLRAETIATYIAESGRLDSYDYLIAKASKGVAKPLDVLDEAGVEAAMGGGPPPTGRKHTDQPPYEEPFLRRSSSREAEAKSLITPVSVERSIKENIRGNPTVSRLVDVMEHNMAEGHLPTLNKVGRNALQFVTLPGASYGSIPSVFKQVGIEVPRRVLGRYVAGWRDSIRQIEAFREVARVQIIDKMPGYRTLMLEKMVDPRSPLAWFSDGLEMAEGFMATPEWRALVNKFQNYTTDAKSGLQMTPPAGLSAAEQLAYNALHNPAVLFGSLPAYGLQAIPLENLSKLYKLSIEELEFIGLVREMPRAGTRLGLAGIGASKLRVFLGKEPSRDYFPRFAVKKGLEKFQKPPLGARPLGQPGVWAKERAIGDAFDAWDSGVFYSSPFDSALDYVADMQRVVADQELIELLQRDNFMEVGHKRWDTQESAARTLLGLAQSVKDGTKPAVAVEQLSKLLGYADPKVAAAIKVDELTRNMGRLAQDLIDNPGRVDDLMPDILAKVKESENAVRATAQMHNLTKGLPGLGNMWFEDSVQAQRAIKFFGEQNKALTKWMQTLNKGSSALRMMQAGVDISFIFIQGLVLPAFGVTRGFEGARIWARSARAALRVHGDPAFMEAYAAHNAEAIKEFVSNTGVWNLPHEMVEQAGLVSEAYGAVGRAATSVIGKPELGAKLKNIPDAAERMFSTFLMYARLELWKSLRPMAGTDGTKLHELASFVNKMTGVYNPATAGITQFQRYMEGTFLSFAPMYRRAAYGLIVDAFRGVPGTARLDARLAQGALVSLAVVGVSMAYILEQSGNNPEALDPGSAKFMSAKIGDSYVGFGSAYYSLVRSVYSATEQALDPSRRGQLGQIWNVRDNQLTRWWRSQAPPIPQAGLDIILGQTYIGEPLRGEDGGFAAAAMGTWGLGQITPMALETILNEVRGVSEAPVVLGESFGMRTFPISVRDKYRRLANNTLLVDQDSEVAAWRQEQEQSGNPLVFDSAPRLIQDRLVRLHPELQAARAEVEKDTLLRGKSDLRERTEYFQQTKKNKEFINKQMTNAAAAFVDTHDSRRFRSAVKEAQAVGFALAMRTSEQFPDVKNWLDDLKQTRADAASGFLGDLIYDKYYANVVLNPLTEDENGNFLPGMYDRLLTQFKIENGLEWWDYVQKRRKEARQHPDLVEEYLSAKESLQPYWKLHYTIWGQYSEEAQLIDEYNSAAPDDKPLMEAGIPRLRRALASLRVQRLKLRDQNPETDWLLAKWYGNEPRTRLARERLAAWLSSRG